MLYYVSDADLPGKQAHTIQQVRMCQAFKRSRIDVCLLHPSYGSIGKRLQWEDICSYYGLEVEFEIQTLPSFHSQLDVIPKAGGLSMVIPMTAWLSRQIISGKIDGSDVIYGRNYYALLFFNELRKVLPAERCPTVVFEIHTPISEHLESRFFRSIDGLVCITHKLRDHVIKQYDIDPSNVLVAPDGVDLEPYQSLTRKQSRRSLGISEDEQVVMYTGHLYPGKGGEILVAAANDIDAEIFIVGGYEDDIERIKTNVGHPENVTFTGFVDPGQIPKYQQSADVLVAPYTEEARDWLSPLKLFEYMAAEVPMVSSDLPVLREVLTHEENALLVPPDDVETLANAVNRLLNSPNLREQLLQNITAEIEKYTWTARAEDIMKFVDDRQ